MIIPFGDVRFSQEELNELSIAVIWSQIKDGKLTWTYLGSSLLLHLKIDKAVCDI